MKVSTRGDYASRALLSLALHADSSGPTSVHEVAERTGLPQPYLEQILLALKGAGLVRSKRGVGGGYTLARPPKEITLAQIVAAVDGPIVAGDFGEPHENGACEHEGQCVLLTVWSEVGQHMRSHPQLRVWTGLIQHPSEPVISVRDMAVEVLFVQQLRELMWVPRSQYAEQETAVPLMHSRRE